MCKCSGKCGCNITSTTKGEKGDASPEATLGYKVYKALLSQSSITAPTVESKGGSTVNTPLVNTIGTITYTYVSVGYYEAKSTALFTEFKTFITMPSTSPALSGYLITTEWVDSSTINITTVNTSQVAANDVLLFTPITIEVHP